jgi:ureidoglycolate lyase
MTILTAEVLTPEAFAPFGDVVDADQSTPVTINQGFAQKFADLAKIDTSHADGHTAVHVFIANPRPSPLRVAVMERHPLGSQLFYPLQSSLWLVLVCTDPQQSQTYRAFRANGQQGVNYARNTWHHPLLVLQPESRFLIVDRAGSGNNLEEVAVTANVLLNTGT